MKKLTTIILLIFITTICLATNPPITNNLVNLSQGLLTEEYEDFVPEMIIEGNTVHALWTNRVGNTGGYLFYCRSTDLGETWETPKEIYKYKSVERASDINAQRLAVSGNSVYIGIADYDYNNNGTGYIYLVKSSDGGGNFGALTELANSGGGFSALTGCFIRASGNKVALVYRDANYNDVFEGLYCLYSGNNGSSFTQTKISEENTSSISDFLFDGTQMIVVHDYMYYYYGLNTGRVFVSVSNDNGVSFNTNKISSTYIDKVGDTREKCYCEHDQRYVSKVTKDGNNIHVIFTGNNEQEIWTVLYARSTNNGETFEKAVDINKGKITNIQSGQESLAAKGGNVYLEYLSTGSKVCLVSSNNNGNTLTEPTDLMTAETHYITGTWWPQLAIDPSDETGKTVYMGAGSMLTRKSTDGGMNFYNSMFLTPFLQSGYDVKSSVLRIDNSGNIHWLSKARWYWSYDFDIFYGNKKPQPLPGVINKALSIETIYSQKNEVVIVPSSPSIAFDSVMTGEAWVKILSTPKNKLNVFGKVNGYDGDTYQPSGYQMTFHESGGKRYLNSGIQTDKGQFINWTGGFIEDTLWHNIAFTYDATAGLNNFKTYFDGLLVAEQTVIGSIIPGDGLILIGSRPSFYKDNNYLVDDIRLWNRALTGKEIIDNQTKTLTGNEEGLKLWLNFDDTFKDISGNGNDAIPVYLGELKVSNFDPPITDFETYQVANEISLNNKTKNASAYKWNFGNGEVSIHGNPKYTYTTAGEYKISLLASNANSVTAQIDSVSIKGLDRVEPVDAGNIGESLLTIYGGGLKTNMKILLRYTDNTEIVADTIVGKGEDGFLQALFTLNGAKTGICDVVVVNNNVEMVLAESFTIKKADGIPQTWVNVSGRSTVLLNRWNKFTITYGNNGDADALMVPVSFAVPDIDGLEVDYMDFKFVLPEEAKEYGLEDKLLPFKDFFISDIIFGKPQRSKVYSLMIPRIKANSSESLHILIKSPVNYNITSWTGDGWVNYTNEPEKSGKNAFISQQLKSSVQNGISEIATGADKEVGSCIIDALGVTVIETSISVIPVVGAIYNSGKTGYVVGQFDTKDVKKSVRNSALQGAATFFSYTSVVPVLGWVTSTVGGLICGGISAYYAVSDCLSLANKEKSVSTVSSFDPNEIIGPDGFGDKGWIQKINEIPYTILFENKAEATAPAHDVFITDTLDLSDFDISDFGFGSFGWGDTILAPPGKKLKEFSIDVDLRPETNIITRVSAKLDTLSGIITWEFLSLNPETMNLEEDPLIGFLPPNNLSSAGEGFVSYTVAANPELKTNSEIRNEASIVFDANKPIVTNNYLNTFDEDAPESNIYPLDENNGSHFLVAWTGSDKGSGIASYSIYVLENDTLFYPWIVNTTELSAEFEGKVGSTYKFYSLATDNVGNIEQEPGQFDASTMVTVGINDVDLSNKYLSVFPNPAEEKLNIKLIDAPCGDYIIELIGINGTVNHSEIYSDFDLNNGIEINLENCTSGQYVLKIMLGNKSISRKIIVK